MTQFCKQIGFVEEIFGLFLCFERFWFLVAAQKNARCRLCIYFSFTAKLWAKRPFYPILNFGNPHIISYSKIQKKFDLDFKK